MFDFINQPIEAWTNIEIIFSFVLFTAFVGVVAGIITKAIHD